VSILDKRRVYELAKELNTTSKRLTEKLAEINIVVKNHMSLLSEQELGALYDHIGIIRQDTSKKTEIHEEKKVNPIPVNGDAKDRDKEKPKKDAKQAPRIIRKTEIIIDTKSEAKDEEKTSGVNNTKNNNNRDSFKRDNRNQRSGFVRSEEVNSGLRAGYIRNTNKEYPIDTKHQHTNNEAIKSTHNELSQKVSEQKSDMNLNDIVEAKKEIKAEHFTEKDSKVMTEDLKNSDTVKKEEESSIKKSEESSPKENMKEREQLTDNKKENIEKLKTENDGVKSEGSSIGNKVADTSIVNGEKENIEKKISAQSVNNTVREGKPQTNRTNDRPFNRGDGQNDRPSGDRPYNRPNDRPNGDRPFNRPNDRPSGDRPYNRPNDRPSGDRPFNRPNDRPSGDRPFNRPNDRPSGDRPFNRPNDRPSGDRPFNRPNDRPGGDRPFNRSNDRPGGDRPFNRPNDRPGGDRPFNRSNDRPNRDDRGSGLQIPKVELTAAQKEEKSSQRSENKREHQNKDYEKDVKRDQKKEVPKGQNNKNQRFKPQNVKLGEKKGVSEALSEDYILSEFYDNDGVKRIRRTPKQRKDGRGQTENKHIPQRAVLTSVKIRESVSVKDLAETLKKTSTEVIKKLMALGIMATLNHELDFDTAAIVAAEYGIKAEKEVEVNEEDILFDESEEDDETEMVQRPPVVVVMGHVDHGKTSLLDAIKSTDVVEGEAGGITQHIGAYTVKINNRNITFLDTPGHEAFTAMRARGAQVTDIAILVVAADDGVMPQTIEAINHAKAANLSIIVAINKIDKPGANPDRVKQELTEYGLVAEEWGGDAICVNVSAKKRENIDGLLEMVLLAADMLELKANPDKQAKGTVIEAKLDKDRGPTATMIVQRGTLKLGDSIVTGTTVGRIRAMVDDKGHAIIKAGPSTPVEILGLPEVPQAGEIFYAITDEKVAKQLAEKRKLKLREQQLKASAKVSLDDLYNQIKEGKVKDLNIIVKADVQGSVQAVKQSLEKLSNEEVRVKIIHGGVGAIAESDVTLAQVSNAIIIGFNVRPGANVDDMAKDAGVDLRLYRIIYNAIEDVQSAMKGMLEPTYKEVVQGHAEIRQIFKVSGIGTIGGCYVTDGKITRNSDVRVIRDGIVVFEGKLMALKRFKDDAKEVAQGYECGMSFEKYNDIKEADVVEAYVMEEVAR